MAASVVLSLQAHSLTPLRMLVCGLQVFAVWAFCDEMGMRKPLVRAGFVAFAIGAFGRANALMFPTSPVSGRYWLLVAMATAGSVLIWSVAYLHRQRDMKVVGAIGALAGAAPIAALVVGHVALGAGAGFGIGALIAAADGAAVGDLSAVTHIDLVFDAWSAGTAWLLFSGRTQVTRQNARAKIRR